MDSNFILYSRRSFSQYGTTSARVSSFIYLLETLPLCLTTEKRLGTLTHFDNRACTVDI